MSDTDLTVTITIPAAEGTDIRLAVSNPYGRPITNAAVVYALFRAASTLMGHMSPEEHAATIDNIEEFFDE